MTTIQHLKALAERAIEVSEKATPGPWKCWNGWGPSESDNLMRCERIGPADCYDGIQPSNPAECPDMRALTEDFEFVAISRTSLPQLAKALIALLPFVQHKNQCKSTRPVYRRNDPRGPMICTQRPCDCGLYDALDAIGKETA